MMGWPKRVQLIFGRKLWESAMESDFQAQHPRFRGNWADLQHFLALARSPIRTQQREDALREWERYKLERHRAAVGRRGKSGYWLAERVIDLSGAELDRITVGYADLRGAILDDCSLRGAWLKGVKFENASLKNANLSEYSSEFGRYSGRLLYSDLCRADLSGANLRGVDLSYAALNDAILADADFSNADLQRATIVRANLEGAILRNTRVYGIAAWDLEGQPAVQQDLVITPMLTESKEEDHLAVSVDNLEVAQFIYLLLNNKKIRDVVDTITSKVVLILGRFSPARKEVLDALRDELRKQNYTPVLFDFERPSSKNFIETIQTLAGMSRFVIADLTDAKVVLQELQAIVHHFPALPIQPLLLKGTPLSVVALDFASPAFLEIHSYTGRDDLIASLKDGTIARAEARGDEIRARRQELQRNIAALNAESSS